MSIATLLRSHQTNTAAEAAERDRKLLAEYRTLLSKDHPDAEDVAAMADVATQLRLDPADVEADQAGLDLSIALRASAGNAARRWKEIEKRLGDVQIGWLMLRELPERAAATAEMVALQAEQIELARATREAVAEINQIRQNQHRISAAVQAISDDILPKSLTHADPLLCAILATELINEANSKIQAQYLRMRGVPMHSSGGWSDPDGIAPLAVAFKRQIQRDRSILPATRQLLNGHSSYH